MAAALAQGEKLQAADDADRAARMDDLQKQTEEVALIGGKFKSQEDLLKAYKELEAKLGGKTPEEAEEPAEEQPEASEEVPEQPEEADHFAKAAAEYESGQLSDETIEELSKMDSKELIKKYVEFYTKNSQQQQAQAVAESEQAAIKQIAGGDKGYAEMIQWAAGNLDQNEINAFNNVTNSGNVDAIKFAVEALNNRYKAAEGHEAPLLSGKTAKSRGPQPYRSQAELARDIANPKYDKDPAFREDVMARLAASQDLL
jgi:hypothetical protein